MKILEVTTRNWNVTGLLDSRKPCRGEKPLKTSTAKTTCTDWELQTACSAFCGSDRTVRNTRDGDEILGTSVTCSGIRRSSV